MKPTFTWLTLLAFVTAAFAFTFLNRPAAGKENLTNSRTPTKIIRCSPDWQTINEWLEESDIPPIPGAGSYKWEISSRHDSARFYFNQGINMYYSFHIIESMASFKKAARFDPESGILYWAQALAYGPNINDLGYAASPAALEAVRKAQQFSGTATAIEKALINTMAVRYTEDSTDTNRKTLNEIYTARMADLYKQFPGHPDIAALYADAMMLEHPWILWKTDGTPHPWTPRIREILEKGLAKSPENPGLNHYYIHVMEPSPYAALAKPSADRLGKLTPGLSHTVHMPSHIYLRTGEYHKGIAVNEAAVKSYRTSIPLYAPVTGADFLYIIHNLHMQANNAMMAGNYEAATRATDELTNSIPADYLDFPGAMGNLIQYIYMTPVFKDIRFGKWDSLLNRKPPPIKQTYGHIIWLFGKGMAVAAQQKSADAKNILEQITELAKDTVLKIPFSPFSPAIDGVQIAIELLRGAILMQEQKTDEALIAFRNAVLTEARMVYNEPRDWILNPRHYLANACLVSGKTAEAINTLKDDLAVNNENGWALFGYWQALVKQQKKTAAAAMKKRFEKAFSKADIKLTAPVF